MRIYKSILIFCLFASNAYISCTSNESLRSKAVNYDSLRKALDSASTQNQANSYHPKRTVQYLKPILDSLSTSITVLINTPLVRPRIRSKSISFFVLPSGRFKLFSAANYPFPDTNVFKDDKQFSAYFKPDSIFNQLLDSIASKFYTDSIPNYKPFLWITGNITNSNTGFNYSFSDTAQYSSGTGGRSKSSIMKQVMKELPRLRYSYQRKLQTSPGLKGKITIKFAINEYGYVIFSGVIDSSTTIGNPDLENQFAEIIKGWKFEKISKPGDITEVIYPFVLSQ